MADKIVFTLHLLPGIRSSQVLQQYSEQKLQNVRIQYRRALGTLPNNIYNTAKPITFTQQGNLNSKNTLEKWTRGLTPQ